MRKYPFAKTFGSQGRAFVYSLSLSVILFETRRGGICAKTPRTYPLCPGRRQRGLCPGPGRKPPSFESGLCPGPGPRAQAAGAGHFRTTAPQAASRRLCGSKVASAPARAPNPLHPLNPSNPLNPLALSRSPRPFPSEPRPLSDHFRAQPRLFARKWSESGWGPLGCVRGGARGGGGPGARGWGGPGGSENGPKMVQTWSENGPLQRFGPSRGRRSRKWYEKGTKIDQK